MLSRDIIQFVFLERSLCLLCEKSLKTGRLVSISSRVEIMKN